MKGILFLALIALFSLSSFNQPTYKMAKLKYNGGGDWYGDRTALTNLIKFCNENLKTNFQYCFYKQVLIYFKNTKASKIWSLSRQWSRI